MKPLTILIAMLSEMGHYNGTFKLARALRARGHKIVYLGLADLEELVRSQGFDFITFAGDLLPRGHSKAHAEKVFDEYLNRINGGDLDDCLRMSHADVLLCDTFVWYVALRALRLGIPTVSISIILSLYQNAFIPPITSGIYPKETWWYPLQVLMYWTWLRIKFFFTKRLASILQGAFRAPTRMHHLIDEFRRIAKLAGYPCRENKTYWHGEIGPRLNLPEIVLCTRSFQLPKSPQDGRRYLGDFVDVERLEDPLPEQALDEDKPLIYCSLGSAASFYPHSRRFFDSVIALSEQKQNWQFVLHIGNFCEPEEFGRPVSNILIAKRVPQLELLRKAALMVTHGGINSIMECVHFEVPMVILPGLRDQPGNAVRATYNNLGKTGEMSKVTPSILGRLIDETLNDSSIRISLAKMRRAIADERGLEQCIEFIEHRKDPVFDRGLWHDSHAAVN